MAASPSWPARCRTRCAARPLPSPAPPHTIDRWDDATGEDLIEQIAAVGDYLVALDGLPGGGPKVAQGQDHAAQPGAGDRAELGGLSGRSRRLATGRAWAIRKEPGACDRSPALTA